MVVHPSPGHYSGTLVNAILHHYSLPAISLEQQAARLATDSSALDSASLDQGHEDDMDGDPYDQEGDSDNTVSFASVAATPPQTEASGMAIPSMAVAQTDVQAHSQTSTAEWSGAVATAHVLPQNGNAAVLRPGIVHRLDKGTTGLMVVCRSPVAMLRLGEQFRARSVCSLCIQGSAHPPL